MDDDQKSRDQLIQELSELRRQLSLHAEERYGGRSVTETMPLEWETLFNAIGSVVWMLDTEFRIKLSNKAAEEIFHLPVDKIIGRYCWDVVHGTSQPIAQCPVVQAMQSQKRESVEMQIGGKWFEVVVDVVKDLSAQATGYVLILNDITDRRRIEEALQSREQQLHALMEASTETVFLMDVEGHLVVANLRTAERLNTNPDSLKKGTIYDFIPQAVAESRKRVIQQVLQTGQPMQFEDERFGRWILNSIYPIKNKNGQVTHLAVYGIDITERKAIEHRLIESEDRYRTIFQNSLSIALIIDPENGRIVDANAAAHNYYGYDFNQPPGKTITEINSLTPEQVFEEMARAKAEQRHYFFFSHRLATGEIRPVEVYSGPVMIEGKQLLYSIVHDISERRKAEEEKEHLIIELREALSKIRTLSGLLPICSNCKKIRDDQGYWMQIESYIKEHSQVDFSHSICPDCMKRLYPEYL